MKTPLFSVPIELLETRIAPAAIIYQAGGAGHSLGEIDYTDIDSTAEDAVFINTEANPNDPISAVVGPGVAGVADTFYMKLTPNALLKVFNNTGFQPLISGDIAGNAGITGTLIAFFVDKNLDNEVQVNELTGIALGSNVKAIISGNVDGDVVSNYNVTLGRLGGTADTLGQSHDLIKNAITDVVISGNVNGSVVSGGQINKLRVGGSVNQVIAGTAANGYTFDFNGAVADGGDQLTVATPAVKVAGISILNTTVGELNLLRAGDGGPGGKGGMLKNITLLADENGFMIAAGNGGAGAGASVTGGAGGTVTTVVINGLDSGEVDETPNALMQILGGNGGNSVAGSSGAGGAGGAVTGVSVGFETPSGVAAPPRSVTAMNDAVLISGGQGGDGKVGGVGGALKTISVFAAPTGVGNDIQILGGVGGDTSLANVASKSGAGGAVTSVTVLNPSTDSAAHDSLILVAGGNAGSAAVGGSGGNGAAVNTASLIGFQLQVLGGHGADGQKVGGNGGGLTSISVSASADGVRAENVVINAGHGGTSSLGRGGAGAAINGLTMVDVDLISLIVNGPGAANGGNSHVGNGGVGGAVSRLDISEFDTGHAGIAIIRTGDGGDGGNGTAAGGNGGAAGAFTTGQISGVQLDLSTTGGTGGDATLKGAGGRGGAVSNLSFFSQKQTGGTEVTATITGGTGGNGLSTGAGGAGGAVNSANIRLGHQENILIGGAPTALVDGGDAIVAGGVGGNSPGGAAGAGGAVTSSTFVTFAGAVSVAGANAGVGVKPAAGGKVDKIAIDVGTAVTVLGGNGSGGGAGGTINNIGFNRTVQHLDLAGTITATAGSAPLGAVTITAGQGSGAGTAAGVGGTINDVSGFVGLSGNTIITAGNGGAVAAKSANGGSVTHVSLFGGGSSGVEVRIKAGDALASASAKVGGIGGSVIDVGLGVNPFDTLNSANPDNVFALDPGVIVRSIAAGNGGDTGLASGKGGRGGDVKNINTHHDLGVRSGEGFGFATMGGIFAGAGGMNTSVLHSPTVFEKKDGAAGSVLQVTADAIAAIVAGRPGAGDIITVRNFVTKVDDIVLNGLNNPTVVDANGTYVNFDTANLIGGVVNPTAVGAPYPTAHPHANTFDLIAGEFIDNDGNGEFSVGDTITALTDGFIAATSFINNLANVRPEALLTSVSGALTFIDLNNTNGQAIQP